MAFMIRRYYRPFPPMTDRAESGPCCSGRVSSEFGGWVCTLPEGHDGDHEAGNLFGQKLASWPR